MQWRLAPPTTTLAAQQWRPAPPMTAVSAHHSGDGEEQSFCR